MPSSLMTGLSNFLIGLITPIVEKLIANSTMAVRVNNIETRQTALIKAMGTLDNANLPDELKAAIKVIAAADNSD